MAGVKTFTIWVTGISFLLIQTKAFSNPIWQRYFESAQELLTKHEDAKAESLFKASLKEARLKKSASVELADSLFAVGATELSNKEPDAETLLRECLKVDDDLCGQESPASGFVHELLGDILLSNKNYVQAEVEFRLAAERLDPIDNKKGYSSRILSKLSKVYFREGKNLEAEALKPATEVTNELAADIATYSSCLKNSSEMKGSASKRPDDMKGFKISMPITETRGVDEHGYPMLTFSAHYPSTQSELLNVHSRSSSEIAIQPLTSTSPNFSSFLTRIQSRCDRAWFPPKDIEESHTIVTFKVLPNGEVENTRITKSSGSARADQAVLKAISNATPFVNPPDAREATTIELKFDQNKSGIGADFHRVTTNKPSSTPDVDYGPYMADLQRRIKHAWFPPKGMEGKRIVVIFKVDRAGTLLDERIGTSSGFKEADEQASLAVHNAAPFRKLPDGARDTVDIQFTFDYNVFTGGGGAAFRRF